MSEPGQFLAKKAFQTNKDLYEGNNTAENLLYSFTLLSSHAAIGNGQIFAR